MTAQFTVQSGAIRISDPCYGISAFYAPSAQTVRAVNGVWQANVRQGPQGGPLELIARHRDDLKGFPVKLERLQSTSVDSAQAGFFDAAYFERIKQGDDRVWYGRVCEKSLNAPSPLFDIDDQGVCVVIGRDGGFPTFANFNEAGEAVALRITFYSGD